jgi:anti-sigma-K factor RskA
MTPIREDDDRHDIDGAVMHALARAVPQVDPSPELRARVLQSLGGHITSEREAGSIAPPRQAWGWWLATAASAAAAIALGIYAQGLRSRVDSLAAELREARILADASQRRVAEVEQTANVAQTSVAVLTAPDVARIDLAGEPAAPAASARAFWSRSRGMVFTGANLPQLPAGRTYQVWVLTDAQAPISAGLLRPDAQGSVNATFGTPPDIPQPVAVAVTIEPEGGVPAPTGALYLRGTV